jgi:hypothetical protein
MANPRRVRHSRGVSYEITYRVEGRMVRQRFPDRRMALDALARARTAALAGTHVFPADARTTLADYAPTWLASLRVDPTTAATYETCLRRHVLPELGDRGMQSLRRSDINTFVGALLAKGLAPSTTRLIYAVLAMLLRAAVYDRLLLTSPCYRINLPVVPQRRLAPSSPAARGGRSALPRRYHHRTRVRAAPGRAARVVPAAGQLPAQRAGRRHAGEDAAPGPPARSSHRR